MTDTVVVEGQVKFRDGKKWKTRWLVLRKPSPVADCLSLLVYKERKKEKEKGRSHKEKLSITLEGICGVEPGPGYDGVAYTLSILCLGNTVTLGFRSREALLAWDARLRYSLGEVHRFNVNVQPGTKLESGPAALHLCNNLLVLTRDHPPAVCGHWRLPELRRYGAVPNGFVFEGGTRCGYWAGVFFLSCPEGEQISFLFDCIVRGISPSRAPHGLRPALPGPGVSPSQSEEQINLEASELEKRLSMLSQCTSSSGTASTYSYSTAIAVDDHSSISSSSSSQSDASYGSRLPAWVEPTTKPHLPTDTPSSSSTLKGLTSSDDRLYAAVMAASMTPPPSKQLHPRSLHDSGRQSSLDSGIGMVAGSQSSYSGSFSSYTGSLDTTSQGGGEEFGSLVSLPAIPPPPPPAPLLPPLSIVEQNSAGSPPCSCPSRSDCSASSAAHRQNEEQHFPSLLTQHYDTPRSLLQSLSLKDHPTPGGSLELGKVRGNEGATDQGKGLHGSTTEPSSQQVAAQCHANVQHSLSWGSETAPSVDSVGRCTPRPTLSAGCPIGASTQCSHAFNNYITPEQWRSAQSRDSTKFSSSPPSGLQPAGPPGVYYTPVVVREEGDDSNGRGAGSDMAGLLSPECPPPSSAPASPHSALCLHRPMSLTDSGSAGEQMDSPKRDGHRQDGQSLMLQISREAPSFLRSDTRPRSDATVNYVNIPISPVVPRAQGELLYMELDLHKPRPSSASSLPTAPREGSTRYAHLDITAMETAQRVGAEHAHGREERLIQLESSRRRAN
ncbi:protein Dok-7 [Lampris incognitus]|uniref:protein Dok-7 n=1 Tax=Lampris incognitus TaxID=2546036 RepID=UPI0024B62308|nr:protein Dok-7 [Lampris incognitus]